MMRGAARRVLVGLLAVVACDKSEAKDEPSREKTDRDEGSSASAKPTSADRPEIITDKVFRPAGGHALLLLEDLPEGWSRVHLRRGGISGMQVFRGTPTDFTGFITLMVFPPIDPAPTKEKMLEQFRSMMASGTPHLVASGAPVPFEGGLATTLAGTSETGVSEKAWLGVVVEGNAAVGIMVRCEVTLFDTQLMPMKDTLLKGLRVGKNVPKLPDTNPSVKLEGVWEHLQGLRLAWMVFDPRGYAHLGSPDDPTWLDFDVHLALGRSLYRYDIEGGNTMVLERIPADPEQTPLRWKFERQDDSLFIADQDHRRIDEAPITLTPGSWEYYDSTDTGNAYTGSYGIAVDESTYRFNADGTYEYSGASSYMHTAMDVGSPGMIDWSAAGYAANAPAKGKWKVEGHQLILDDGKTKAVRTIYASKHSAKVVYIGGLKYVKMK
jgi:hypothetical protein